MNDLIVIDEVTQLKESEESKRNTKIKLLENHLMLLGFSGMAYTERWNEVAEELNELKGGEPQ